MPEDHPLSPYSVLKDLPVRWGDMDAFQHVKNVIYFKYFESARNAHFENQLFRNMLRQQEQGPEIRYT